MAGDHEKGRKPTHRLKVLNKTTGEADTIGVAWANKDGSITIRLKMLVVMPADSNLVYTLFPVDKHPANPA